MGMMVVPQSLAYAVIAELPYQYGLFSAFCGVMVYCWFGMSKDITVGPTAIMSLLVATQAEVGVARVLHPTFVGPSPHTTHMPHRVRSRKPSP